MRVLRRTPPTWSGQLSSEFTGGVYGCTHFVSMNIAAKLQPGALRDVAGPKDVVVVLNLDAQHEKRTSRQSSDHGGSLPAVWPFCCENHSVTHDRTARGTVFAQWPTPVSRYSLYSRAFAGLDGRRRPVVLFCPFRASRPRRSSTTSRRRSSRC